jgi:hypothetical protein
LTFRKVNIFENISKNLDYILLESYLFCRFQGLPAGCVCVAAACGASATSEKTRPWNFGAYILWILSILSNFVDFRVPKVVLFQNQDTCPFSKPRHLSFFKTKTSVLFQNQDTCPFSKPRHLSFFKTKTPVLFQNQDICPFSKPRHLSFFKTKTPVLFQNQDTCPFSKPRHLSFFKTKTCPYVTPELAEFEPELAEFKPELAEFAS